MRRNAAADGQNKLGEHAVHIRRMVLRLRPEQRFLRHERHLIRVARLCRNAKVDIADNARAVVPAEEIGGYAVFQVLFTDRRWITRSWKNIIADTRIHFAVFPSSSFLYHFG